MKPREPRQKVMIKARMRVGASWNDVCILDISTRGLSMQAAAPPSRGTYLEVRRGAYEMTACVMWSNGHRFGVRTQDPLVIDDFINCSDRSKAEANDVPAAALNLDRRRWRRSSAERHENSRMMARSMEFATIGIFVASIAVMTFGTVIEALKKPLAEASAALDL